MAKTCALAYDHQLSQVPDTNALPVVFVGSLGATRSMWEAQMRFFSSLRPVVAVDIRGHGDSPVLEGPYTMSELANDVVELLDKLDISQAHFVGLSLGGAIVQQLAHDHSHRVASIVLVSTAARFGDKQSWEEKSTLVRQQGTQALAAQVAQRWFTQPYGQEGSFDMFTKIVSDCPDEGYASCCEALAEFDSHPWLPTLELPALVISADNDPSTPPEVVTDLYEHINGAEFVSIAPAAHLVNIEQAEKFNQIVAKFLSQHG